MKKYQVFISSTYRDLIEERKAVSDALLDNECIPVGMEQFPAFPCHQWKYITEKITESDYFVILVAWNYGTIDQKYITSYTEREFDFAREQKIPVLAFLSDESAEGKIENPELNKLKIDRQKKFRTKIENSGIIVNYYKNVDDLKYKVAKSININKYRTPRLGWEKRENAEANIYKLDQKKDKIEITDSGKCGNECKWFYNHETRTLIITGEKIQKLELGKYPWKNCTSVTCNVVLSSKLLNIADNAFAAFIYIHSIIIPPVKSIGVRAFWGCFSLRTVTFSQGIIEIKDSAFSGCIHLFEVHLPNGICKLGNTIFQYCFSLTKVYIPESVKEIGNGAFEGCHNIIILGKHNSYVEAYANLHGIRFALDDTAENNIHVKNALNEWEQLPYSN